MNAKMPWSLSLPVLLGTVVTACATSTPGSASRALEPGVTRETPPDLRVWATKPSTNYVWVHNGESQTVVLWGDPKTGAYGSINKFPAGTTIPAHTHTTDGHCIVLTGTMYNARVGEAEVACPPNSFFVEPGGIPHVTRCGKDSGDCSTYCEQEGFFDYNPVDQQ